ncbi:TlpA family protein disulfide reductase [Alicyclobacillus sp. ALC3]|uniref:TlpA family protein disulfide reductase n=1 Tax=Alicyclobacillus sp. ALC3 TaxID=2796143 RepID=UPI00237945D8|nr:TlpA disulfide reductase family protein [Alicyclobacillus sp. ALC3]WDL96831.1 TlpA family protein disulfide reductase [Alicyclobacillus sp. ALC3]
MKRRQKWLTGGVVALALMFAAGCGTIGGGGQPTGTTDNAAVQTTATGAGVPIVGKAAPSFSLPTLNGNQTVSLQSLLGKKPLIINAWASWCKPCNIETPDLVKLSKQYGQQVQFVGVNLTSLDSVAQAKAFVINYHIPYPILSDPQGMFDKTYGILSVPTTYVISSKGKVVDVHIGIMSKQLMQSLVKQAIQAG